ncbi:MAG TPA: hypothetical protein VMP01_29355 [Pirellulaceae bacterium]|nr:hypothetical protein [Pirellulaceae bacterium]
MSELVQNSLAIAACLAAACFVAWRAWKAFQGRSSGCGSGCGSCPSAAKKSPVQSGDTLLTIDAPAAAALPPERTTR